jgi:hypothetical protein
MSQLIDRWNIYTTQLRNWLGGTVTGGPYGDGRYPLTDSYGVTFFVPCPAAEAERVDGVVGSASSFSTLAEASKVAAGVAKVAAEDARNVTLTYRDSALASKNLAETYMNTAGSHAANAIAARDAAVAAAASVTVDAAALEAAVAAADADRVAAQAARVAAEAAAAAAATFDPAHFYTKTAADARYSLAGHAHTFASLTSKPTTLGGYGITDAVDIAASQSVAGMKTFTFGALRVQGWSGDARSGVLYLGNENRYVYQPAGAARMEFRFSDAGYAQLDSNGTIWTTATFNPATKAPVHEPTFTGRVDMTGGSLRVYGYTGSSDSGVVYFGTNDRYIYRAANDNTFYFKFGPGQAASLNAQGVIWTDYNFNPNNKLNYRSELAEYAHQVGDWNQAVNNGWYMAADALNAPPGGGWYMGRVSQHNPAWIQQEAWRFTNGASTQRFRRHLLGGAWGPWTADLHIHDAVYTGQWPGNSVYGGLMTVHGMYMIMADAGPTASTYIGANGDVVMRAGGNDPNKQLTLRSSDGAVVVVQGLQANTLSTANANGAYLRGNGGGLEARGLFYTYDGLNQLSANGATWVRQPRIFVGGPDPGPQAVDGDVWIP